MGYLRDTRTNEGQQVTYGQRASGQAPVDAVPCDGHRKEQAMGYGKDVREELRVPSRELRHAIPQVYAGYEQPYDSALGAGALGVRTKELIALAIAVSKDSARQRARPVR
jgi:hypothetical protein